MTSRCSGSSSQTRQTRYAGQVRASEALLSRISIREIRPIRGSFSCRLIRVVDHDHASARATSAGVGRAKSNRSREPA